MKFQSWPDEVLAHIDPARVLTVDAPEGETRFCYVAVDKKPPGGFSTMRLCFRVRGSVAEVSALLGRS